MSRNDSFITLLAATESLIRQKDQKHMGQVTFNVRFEMHSGAGSGGPSISGKELQVKGGPPLQRWFNTF